jgi:hypothetical protein
LNRQLNRRRHISLHQPLGGKHRQQKGPPRKAARQEIDSLNRLGECWLAVAASVWSRPCVIVGHDFRLSFVFNRESQRRSPRPLVDDGFRKLAHVASTVPKVLGVRHCYPPSRVKISVTSSI